MNGPTHGFSEPTQLYDAPPLPRKQPVYAPQPVYYPPPAPPVQYAPTYVQTYVQPKPAPRRLDLSLSDTLTVSIGAAFLLMFGWVLAGAAVGWMLATIYMGYAMVVGLVKPKSGGF